MIKLKEKEFGKDTFRCKAEIWFLYLLPLVSGPLFRHLQKRGIHVMFKVIEDDKDFEEGLKNAPYIDGIITDRPSHLKSWLESK